MVITMTKKSEKGRKSLNVSPHTHQLVGKIAAHRELTVEELFEEQDMQEFLTHLLVEEMRKTEQRLKGKR